MIKKIYNELKSLLFLSHRIFSFQQLYATDINKLKILQGKTLLALQKENKLIKNISDAEFSVYSQWGDDGIIQYLVRTLDIKHEIFIEFGVENYIESNTRFLLINNNWHGLVMDGSQKNIDYIWQDDISWQHDITSMCAFITKENINELLSQHGFPKEIGLLHIDIDGNDYWVWKAINCLEPVIVIMEYNSVFGNNPWTVPYRPDFQRSKYHYSNLCAGVSLTSLCDLAEEKGYAFIGSNSNGNNAYFVRKDKLGPLKAITADEGYVLSRFREGLNEQGQLSFIAGIKRLDVIKGCTVFNTRTGQTERI